MNFSARQYGLLLRTGVRLSLTGSRGAGSGGDGSRHILSAASGLTLSTLVAAILLGHASMGQYALIIMTLSMVFTATAVIAELAGGLFNPRDAAICGHLPISPFTRFSARFSELVFILVILTLNLTLVPSIVFGFHCSDPGATLRLLAAGMGVSLFTASLCLVAYLLLARFLGGFRLQGLLLYVNILVTLGIFGLIMNTGRLMQSGMLSAVKQGAWPSGFPPAWFAQAASGMDALPALAALAAAVVPLLLASSGMEMLIPTQASRGMRSAPGAVMRLFEALFVRKGERAAFEFTAVHLARERGFRLKAYPILGFPVLIIALSLFEAKPPLFYIFMLHLVNLYLPLVIGFLPFSDDYKAAWIFSSLPIEGRVAFASGAEKAFIYRIVAPLFVLNAVALGFVWSPVQGVLHAFYAALAGLFLVRMRFFAMEAYPFSREFRGALSREALAGALSIGVMVLGVLGWIQYLACSSTLTYLIAVAAMLGLHALGYMRPPGSRPTEEPIPEIATESLAVETPRGMLRAHLALYLVFALVALAIGVM